MYRQTWAFILREDQKHGLTQSFLKSLLVIYVGTDFLLGFDQYAARIESHFGWNNLFISIIFSTFLIQIQSHFPSIKRIYFREKIDLKTTAKPSTFDRDDNMTTNDADQDTFIENISFQKIDRRKIMDDKYFYFNEKERLEFTNNTPFNDIGREVTLFALTFSAPNREKHELSNFFLIINDSHHPISNSEKDYFILLSIPKYSTALPINMSSFKFKKGEMYELFDRVFLSSLPTSISIKFDSLKNKKRKSITNHFSIDKENDWEILEVSA